MRGSGGDDWGGEGGRHVLGRLSGQERRNRVSVFRLALTAILHVQECMPVCGKTYHGCGVGRRCNVLL